MKTSKHIYHLSRVTLYIFPPNILLPLPVTHSPVLMRGYVNSETLLTLSNTILNVPKQRLYYILDILMNQINTLIECPIIHMFCKSLIWSTSSPEIDISKNMYNLTIITVLILLCILHLPILCLPNNSLLLFCHTCLNYLIVQQ